MQLHFQIDVLIYSSTFTPLLTTNNTNQSQKKSAFNSIRQSFHPRSVSQGPVLPGPGWRTKTPVRGRIYPLKQHRVMWLRVINGTSDDALWHVLWSLRPINIVIRCLYFFFFCYYYHVFLAIQEKGDFLEWFFSLSLKHIRLLREGCCSPILAMKKTGMATMESHYDSFISSFFLLHAKVQWVQWCASLYSLACQ